MKKADIPKKHQYCQKCHSAIEPEWVHIKNLDGWIGESICSKCNQYHFHVTGSAKFQQKMRKIIEKEGWSAIKSLSH